jgi:hypothetical protein
MEYATAADAAFFTGRTIKGQVETKHAISTGHES